MNNRERSFGTGSVDADPKDWESRSRAAAATIAGGILVVVVAMLCAIVTVNADRSSMPPAPQILAAGSSDVGAKPDSALGISGPVGVTPAPASPSTPPPTQTAFTAPNNDAENYSNADKAYCKWQGKLLRVGISGTYQAAVCTINGHDTYLGLDKATGNTTKLPATVNGAVVKVVNLDYVYSLDASEFKITEGSKVIGNEKMISWLGPEASELLLPGDLGISQPISYPECDGTGMVILGVSWDPSSDASNIQQLLNANPGSQYVRTDLTCDNFRSPSNENSDGKFIYAVIRLVPGDKSTVCAAMGEYKAISADWLENNVDPTLKITCP